MQDQNKQSNQSRFIAAAVLSLAFLVTWTYFFTPEKPATDVTNANVNANSNVPANNSGPATPAQTETVKEETAAKELAESAPDDVAGKKIKIKTPLYEVILDNKGAVATSWILFRNDSSHKNEQQPLYADTSTKDNKIPLQLISQRGIKEKPEQAPFKLKTGDAKLDAVVNQRNYSVSAEETEIVLAPGATKELTFSMTGPDGIKSEKKFVFRAESYIADVSVKLTKNDAVVPNTKFVIGPSIGDQGIPHYTFYKVAPEAVYNTSVDQNRQYAASLDTEDKGSGSMKIDGEVDWAGIADTYFAMVVVPVQEVGRS